MAAPADTIDGRPAEYGLSLKELRELMEHRGSEGYELMLTKYNGVTEMCRKLYTSPNEGKQNQICVLLLNNHFDAVVV